MNQIRELFDTVVSGDYCIGCGACAAVEGSPVRVQLDRNGRMKAVIEPGQMDNDASVLDVCPFAHTSMNEDVLGRELFSRDCSKHEKIGYHFKTYAGHVTEAGFRQKGSSGGLGSWFLVELLKRDMVDAVIHIHERKPTAEDGRLFAFGISLSEDEIRNGAKSRYYPVEMSEVLRTVKERPMRYAIVGVPCFIKAVRLLQKKDPVVAERIRYCIGLVCGHLKSTAFAEMFAWESGVMPRELQAIDFRKKFPERSANDYGVLLKGKDGAETVRACKDFKGYDWGKGFFKYNACDYCDDVLAETADLVIGDAWLPEYIRDGWGTNIAIVRRAQLDAVLNEGISAGRLVMNTISAEDIARSQDAGLRHRREGLAYRLHLKDSSGAWRPVKRVKPSENHLTDRQKRIFELRIELAKASHEHFARAKASGDYPAFQRHMEPLIRKYDSFYAPPLVRRIKDKTKRIIKRILGYKNV